MEEVAESIKSSGPKVFEKANEKTMPECDNTATIKDRCRLSSKESVFSNGCDTPGDLAINAFAVTRFLKDLLPAMAQEDYRLTEDGVNGLFLILAVLENTMSAVCDDFRSRD